VSRASTPREPAEYKRAKTGRLVPCPGEAHSNPWIDHCGHCAPRWGQVEELAPVDLDAARAAGLDVAIRDLTDEQIEQADRDGFAYVVRVKRGAASYCVLRWVVGGEGVAK
jgi:hypothetical protein